ILGLTASFAVFANTAKTNAAVITDLYNPSSLLSPYTITDISPLGASVIASVLAHTDNTPPTGIGDDTIRDYVRSGASPFPGWGGTLTPINGGGDCPANCSIYGKKGLNGAIYTGPAASIFMIHWGGSEHPLLGLKFAVAVSTFNISGFDQGV